MTFTSVNLLHRAFFNRLICILQFISAADEIEIEVSKTHKRKIGENHLIIRSLSQKRCLRSRKPPVPTH